MGRDAPWEGWGWFAALRTVVITNNRRDGINVLQLEFWLQTVDPPTPPSLGNLPPYHPLQGPGFYAFQYVLLLDFKVPLHGCRSFPAPPRTFPHPCRGLSLASSLPAQVHSFLGTGLQLPACREALPGPSLSAQPPGLLSLCCTTQHLRMRQLHLNVPIPPVDALPPLSLESASVGDWPVDWQEALTRPGLRPKLPSHSSTEAAVGAVKGSSLCLPSERKMLPQYLLLPFTF